MISTLMVLEISSITRTVLTCAKYARSSMEDECFLKSTEPDRVMKSECVTHEAPQAIDKDWRMMQ